MPANDGQRSQCNPEFHEADDRLLARLCHPSTRIAEHLLEPMGLRAWPTPTLTRNPPEPLESASSIASMLAQLQVLDVEHARDDGRSDIV